MAAPRMLQAPIILLKEGTDTSQGRPQICSNITACQAVADIVKTTLGPRGMDKLIYSGGSVTITNDGATVMQLLNVVHPAAKVLVDIAQAQDDEIGDGTTSVVVLAGEFMAEAKRFLEEGIAPSVVVRGFAKARDIVLDRIKQIAVDIGGKDESERNRLLQRCAATSLNSKLLSNYRDYFAKMVVEAVTVLGDDLDKSMIGVKKVPGGSVLDSFLVTRGVAFKKTFSYAGFEQQPKKLITPKVLLLNLELELKAEKENAEIRVETSKDYQAIVNAEWQIIYEKLENIVKSGAEVVLSKLPIGDLATQYFADRQIFCAGRVEEADLKRTARATGAEVQTTVHRLNPDVMGTCGVFEEVQIGQERFNIFRECPKAHAATIVLRGGAQQFIDEAERSLNDAVMIVRRAVKAQTVVGGGGAVEAELSRYLRDYSRTIGGKEQIVMNAYAKALEVIPRTLATNSGLDAIDLLNKMRQKHVQQPEESMWIGVDCVRGGVCDTYAEFIWEPSVVKSHAISAATDAACLILSIDETVKNPKSNPEPDGPNAQAAMAAAANRGRGMRRR